MTVIKRIFLKCDRCAALASLVGSESVVEARSEARKLVWVHTKDGRDLCRSCRSVKPGYQTTLPKQRKHP